eukprot:TRINITY_DN23558_c0_g1_i1.p1 TRINITY_DN23558_c0_g1~~TRINITY_DN23558_c0_g1_i1.p1  ORF type:complete len:161 (-),score=30.95 TRINITY_DN23558_c0_g1_i1:44-526(-)
MAFPPSPTQMLPTRQKAAGFRLPQPEEDFRLSYGMASSSKASSSPPSSCAGRSRASSGSIRWTAETSPGSQGFSRSGLRYKSPLSSLAWRPPAGDVYEPKGLMQKCPSEPAVVLDGRPEKRYPKRQMLTNQSFNEQALALPFQYMRPGLTGGMLPGSRMP